MSVDVRTPNSEIVAAPTAQSRAGGWPGQGLVGPSLKLLQVLVLTVLAYASYLFISHFLLSSVQVVGESMLPSLHDSEHLLLNRWIYYLRSPRAGEIVVFRDPIDHALAIKRVIGLPGDVADFHNGSVYLNGRELAEPYLASRTPTFPFMTRKAQSFICGEGQYLVLGDNRKNSADSRTYGLILRREILGRVVH
jgi:signal peptidase I